MESEILFGHINGWMWKLSYCFFYSMAHKASSFLPFKSLLSRPCGNMHSAWIHCVQILKNGSVKYWYSEI